MKEASNMTEEVNVVWSVIFNMGIQMLLIVFVFYILYLVGWKPFLKYLQERQNVVTTVIVEAEQQKDEATELFVAAQTKLQNINDKTEAMLQKAEKTAKLMVEQQQESLKIELERKRLAADKQIEYDKKRLQEEMQKQAVEMAAQVAAQFLESKASKEQTEKQIDTFMKKLGDE